MKRIIVCVIIFLVSISIFSGCLPGIGSNPIKKADSECGHSMDDHVAESMSSYGYAFLHAASKGGVIS